MSVPRMSGILAASILTAFSSASMALGSMDCWEFFGQVAYVADESEDGLLPISVGDPVYGVIGWNAVDYSIYSPDPSYHLPRRTASSYYDSYVFDFSPDGEPEGMFGIAVGAYPFLDTGSEIQAWTSDSVDGTYSNVTFECNRCSLPPGWAVEYNDCPGITIDDPTSWFNFMTTYPLHEACPKPILPLLPYGWVNPPAYSGVVLCDGICSLLTIEGIDDTAFANNTAVVADISLVRFRPGVDSTSVLRFAEITGQSWIDPKLMLVGSPAMIPVEVGDLTEFSIPLNAEWMDMFPNGIAFCASDEAGNLIVSLGQGVDAGATFEDVFPGWTVETANADLFTFFADPGVQSIVGMSYPESDDPPLVFEVLSFDSTTGSSQVVGSLAPDVLPGLIPGDLNEDGMVNSADLDIVRSHWCETVIPGHLAAGDASGDGSVGSADLDMVRGNWETGITAVVPEPGVLCLGLAGTALLAFRLRRWNVRENR